MVQMAFKRRMNKEGVIDSNGTVFQFLIPSFFSAIFTAIGQGIANSGKTFTTLDSTGTASGTITYANVVQAGRNSEEQGGFQMLAWVFSVGMGAVAGLVIGLLYNCMNDYDHHTQLFNDGVLYNYPGADGRERKYTDYKPTEGQPSNNNIPQDMSASRTPAILEFDYYER